MRSAPRSPTSLFRSSVIALAAEVVTLLCHAATIHLYAARFGEIDLADYLIALAGIAISSQVLGLGLHASLLYYVGKEPGDGGQARTMLVTCLAMVGTVSVAVVMLLTLATEPLAKLYFGKPGREGLLLAVSLLLVARVLTGTCLGYFWGRSRAVAASTLHSLIWGAVPLIVVAFGFPRELDALLLQTAVLSLVVVFALSGWELRGRVLRPSRWFDLTVARRMLGYGIPRTPATMGIILVYSSPAILAAWLGCDEKEVIVIGAAAALLRMTSVLGRVVTFVGMPRVSRLNRERQSLLHHQLRRIAPLTGAAAVIGVVGFWFLGDTVLRYWLERPALETDGMTTFFWLSVAPFMLFLVSRPILDGLSERAYVTINVFYGVLGGAGALWLALRFLPPARALGIALAVAMTIMALSSVHTLWWLMRTTGSGAPPPIRPGNET